MPSSGRVQERRSKRKNNNTLDAIAKAGASWLAEKRAAGFVPFGYLPEGRIPGHVVGDPIEVGRTIFLNIQTELAGFLPGVRHTNIR